MSASDKKKLRKEQRAAQLTERQKKEQSEAKKLKVYSTVFIALIIVVAVVGLSVMAVKAVNRTGIIDRNTTAMYVGDEAVNSVELNYYYNDLLNATYNEYYSAYGDNAPTYVLLLYGLDITQPLDKQAYDSDEYETWADYFLDTAKQTLRNDRAMAAKAAADGFELTEEDQDALTANIENLGFYATMYGYPDLEDYLVAAYGFGATEDTYKAYAERSKLASAYYEAHNESLTYEDSQLRAYEKEHFDEFSSFTYAICNLNSSEFLGEGTKDEEGNVTYTDEEKAAAIEAAKEAADKLAESKTVLELDKAYAALEINADDDDAASTKHTNQLYSNVNSSVVDWLANSNRKDGDVTVIPNESTTTDEDGNEKTTINGYYVVMFQSRNDNTEPMANVRHLLVSPKGGTKNETTGETTYSDEEWAAAKEDAEMLLKTWQEDDPTEESFIEMVKESSDDTSAAEGGLFEDIHPDSNYVESFLNWSIDPERKTGDAEIIESEYGYHIMYYVGDDELTYRDHMITSELRAQDLEKWFNGIVEAVTYTDGDLSRINTSKAMYGA